MTELRSITEIIDGFELEERRTRAIRIVRARGAMDAPAWVWDVIDSWDTA